MRFVGGAVIVTLTACASSHWRTLSTEQLESRLTREFGRAAVTNSLQFLSEANNWNAGPDEVAVISLDHIYVLKVRYQWDRAPTVQIWSMQTDRCAPLQGAIDAFNKHLRAFEDGTTKPDGSVGLLDPASESVRRYDAQGVMIQQNLSPGGSVSGSGHAIIGAALACKT